MKKFVQIALVLAVAALTAPSFVAPTLAAPALEVAPNLDARSPNRKTVAPPGPPPQPIRHRDVSHHSFEIGPQGDTIGVVWIKSVPCFSKPMDLSRHRKLVRDFRKVYPLALVAREKMAGFEEQMLALPTRKAQREFARRTERSLVAEYTPTLKRMTVSQGKILLRLIDRETNMTSYQIVKEFRGGFVAGFWQGVARIFGHNLKDEYDVTDRDRLVEQCIWMYNAGLLPEY